MAEASGVAGKGGRRASRELVLRALYSEVCGGGMGAGDGDRRLVKIADLQWRDRILESIEPRLAALDAIIAEMSCRELSEIDSAELCVLRLAGHELEFAAEVPWKVVVDEAVRLAKLYCGPESYRFVNGIVERMAFRFRPDEATRRRDKI